MFWSFTPYIDEFNFCKTIIQVDGTFLTRKYHDIMLIAISQDDNQNLFSLAFVIVEGEIRETLIWFFQLLRQYITPQSKLCRIFNREISIMSKLQYEKVGWESDGFVFVYCKCHMTSNFNKKFKNYELRLQLIDMGNDIAYLSSYKITQSINV